MMSDQEKTGEDVLVPISYSDQLIRVTQLPIIEERLRVMKEFVDSEVGEALSLVCTEDTVKSVKAKRAEIRKQFEKLEAQRKAVKSAVFAPYERFEAVYKECVSDAFKNADSVLKSKIDDVEMDIKRRKEEELRRYFDELCILNKVEWLRFEMSGVKVDMASAKQKTPKKLRDQLKSFVESVSKDIDVISSMEYPDELLSEYKRCLDVASAIGIVNDYHRRAEAEQHSLEERKDYKSKEAEVVEKVESLAPPAMVENVDTLTVTFTVTDTRERLISLREWLKTNNYDYQ